jgi:hypothetical protein
MGGQKVNFLAEIFIIDAGILCVLVVKKKSDFFYFKKKIMCHFKSNTCSISMVDFQA